MTTKPFPWARGLMTLCAITVLWSLPARAQLTDFFDDFTMGPLDPAYDLVTPANHIGYNGAGQYRIDTDGYLRYPPGGLGSFTADLRFWWSSFATGNSEVKFRFFGGQFIEFVLNQNSDSIRVYSAELGANFINESGLGLAENVPINLRLTYDNTTGNVKIGFSTGNDPLELVGAANGLVNFRPDIIDFGANSSSDPVILLDRFELQDEVLPIGLAIFEELFDGPALDPSWNLIQSQPGDHVGFIGGGFYEVTKTTTTGEAGLSRDLVGSPVIVSTVEFQAHDFISSDSEVLFRHPVSGDSLDVILDSTGDVRVEAGGATVTELFGFGFQNGDTLELIVTSTDTGGDRTEVGLRHNGGAPLRIAVLNTAYLSVSSEVVLIKSATGNGNSPRLLLDRYFVDAEFVAVPLAPFLEDFTGPALDGSWSTSDSGSGSLVGFNDIGQYEISPGTNVTAGLSRFIGYAGDATYTFNARLADFLGTDSELRFALTGGDALTVILRSDDTLEIVSEDPVLGGSVFNTAGLGLSDGDLVTMKLSIDTDNGDWSFGLGINGAPGYLAGDSGYADLNPNAAEITVVRGAGGSQPSILLDQTSVSEGFAVVTQVAEAFSDTFNAGPLDGDWNATGLTHLGYPDGQAYAIEATTNSIVSLNRLLAPGGYPGIPVGSFSAFLDVRFDQLVGSGTDFKVRIEGVNHSEIVFNSFETVRFFTANNGQSWFNSSLTAFNEGDTVNFGIVYDASVPSLTMSVGLNGMKVFEETRSNLVGVSPESINITGFKFSAVNPPATFLLDQLDINPGLPGVVPGPLAIATAHSGLYMLTWDLGTLQTATELDGIWNDLPTATSPHLINPTDNHRFFRME